MCFLAILSSEKFERFWVLTIILPIHGLQVRFLKHIYTFNPLHEWASPACLRQQPFPPFFFSFHIVDRPLWPFLHLIIVFYEQTLFFFSGEIWGAERLSFESVRWHRRPRSRQGASNSKNNSGGTHTRTHSINHYFDIAATRRESLRRSVTQGCWWDFSQCVCVDWLNLSASENSFEEHIPHLLLNIFKQKKRNILAIPCDARALQHSVSVKWVRKRSLLWCLLSLLDKRSSTISRPYAKISLLEALIFIIFL